jgi:hypothetical protein
MIIIELIQKITSDPNNPNIDRIINESINMVGNGGIPITTIKDIFIVIKQLSSTIFTLKNELQIRENKLKQLEQIQLLSNATSKATEKSDYLTLSKMKFQNGNLKGNNHEILDINTLKEEEEEYIINEDHTMVNDNSGISHNFDQNGSIISDISHNNGVWPITNSTLLNKKDNSYTELLNIKIPNKSEKSFSYKNLKGPTDNDIDELYDNEMESFVGILKHDDTNNKGEEIANENYSSLKKEILQQVKNVANKNFLNSVNEAKKKSKIIFL